MYVRNLNLNEIVLSTHFLACDTPFIFVNIVDSLFDGYYLLSYPSKRLCLSRVIKCC